VGDPHQAEWLKALLLWAGATDIKIELVPQEAHVP